MFVRSHFKSYKHHKNVYLGSTKREAEASLVGEFQYGGADILTIVRMSSRRKSDQIAILLHN